MEKIEKGDIIRYRLSRLDRLLLFQEGNEEKLYNYFCSKEYRDRSEKYSIFYLDSYYFQHAEPREIKDKFEVVSGENMCKNMLDYIIEVRKKIIYYYVMFAEEYYPSDLIEKKYVEYLYNRWYQETTDFLEKNKGKFGPDFVDNDSYFLLAVHKYKERRQVELFKMALIEAMKNNVEEEKVVLTFK